LAARLASAGPDPADRIRLAYRLLYSRPPGPDELRLGEAFAARNGWPQYAQVLLGSAEFSAVN
jgi:hypothetical protein